MTLGQIIVMWAVVVPVVGVLLFLSEEVKRVMCPGHERFTCNVLVPKRFVEPDIDGRVLCRVCLGQRDSYPPMAKHKPSAKEYVKCVICDRMCPRAGLQETERGLVCRRRCIYFVARWETLGPKET